MKVTVITPYTTEGTKFSGIRPLVAEQFDVLGFEDITGRSGEALALGLPSVNLYVVNVVVSGQTLAQIKADNTYFVLEPGPGYNGSALKTWLEGKGAQGHGIVAETPAEEALSTLKTYFKNL